MSASDTNAARSDAEWAAGVMGLVKVLGGWNTSTDAGHGTFRFATDWNPDTDANDLRDFLNCEAVRGWRNKHKCIERCCCAWEEVWSIALTDQPAALRQLRSAMEGPSGRE